MRIVKDSQAKQVQGKQKEISGWRTKLAENVEGGTESELTTEAANVGYYLDWIQKQLRDKSLVYEDIFQKE